MYYILSFKHQRHHPELCFWCVNDSGYTSNLLQAGMYSREQVLGKLDYYHKGQNSVAIAVDRLPRLTDKLVARFDHLGGPVLTVEVWPVSPIDFKERMTEAAAQGQVFLDWFAPDRFHFEAIERVPQKAQ